MALQDERSPGSQYARDGALAFNRARAGRGAALHPALRPEDHRREVRRQRHGGRRHALRNLPQDIVLMKQTGIDPVVVHGGGPQIGAMLEKLEIPRTFVDGLARDGPGRNRSRRNGSDRIDQQADRQRHQRRRRTRRGAVRQGQHAATSARKIDRTNGVDLGFVGEPEKMNPDVLRTIMRSEIIPVMAPIGVGAQGETFNINADTVAGSVACAMKAERLHASHRCRRRAGSRQEADPASDRRRSARTHRRRHDQRAA